MTIDLRLGDCLELMKSLPDQSVDAVITDPPWNMGYFEDDQKSWGMYAEWLNGLKTELERISSNTVFIFQSSKAIPFVSHLFGGYGAFASCKNFVQIVKGVSNAWDIAFYHQREITDAGDTPINRNWVVSNTAPMGGREKNGHPTQRAENGMGYILGLFTRTSDTVLDPFMGSGTTGVACVKLNRNFIGMEINPDYFAIAKRRIEEAQMQLTLPMGIAA